jgi:Terpene synthase family 2, C-terminal metal binding
VVNVRGETRPLFDACELSSISIPRLHVSFPVERSPHVKRAEDGACRYLRDHESARLATLTGSTYPLASVDDLQLVTEWISVNLVLDDLFDQTELGRDPDGVAGWAARVLECLPADLPRNNVGISREPVLRAYSDLWRRTAPRMSREWRLRFAGHVRDFLSVCRWEAANRRNDRIPDLGEYITKRGCALHPYLDLVELTTGAELPTGFPGSDLARLHQVVSDADLWTNDLFSFVQEAQRGDPHNLVTVHAAAHNCTVAEAVTRVAALVQERIDESARLCAAVAAAGIPSMPLAELDAHLRALRGWVAGQLAWRYATRRFDPDGSR